MPLFLFFSLSDDRGTVGAGIHGLSNTKITSITSVERGSVSLLGY